MSQTDVKSVRRNAVGSMVGYRTRIKGISFLAGTLAGTFILTDGTAAGGAVLLQIDTGATSFTTTFMLPGEGILAYNGVYLETLTNTVAVTVIYG